MSLSRLKEKQLAIDDFYSAYFNYIYKNNTRLILLCISVNSQITSQTLKRIAFLC